MFRKRHRRTKQVHAELNITAFMNLMVVLIPFLLITAVFSQVTILKLNLPGAASNDELFDDKPAMQLEVIIRSSKLVLAERNSGVISEFLFDNDAVDSNQTPYMALNQKLQLIKAQVSEATTITILAEPETSYDLIIQTMDAVRLIVPEMGSGDIPGELFPDVSIGSAPYDPSLETTSEKDVTSDGSGTKL